MWSIRRIITALTIVYVVLQVCTCSPTGVEEEVDVTKLFTAEELQMARDADLSVSEIIRGKEIGVTLVEMTKIAQIAKLQEESAKENNYKSPMYSFSYVAKVCEVFLPGQKTSTNYTDDQEAGVENLMQSIHYLPFKHQLHYFKAFVCAYISEPFLPEANANSFGLELIPYLKFGFLKLQHQGATGVESVNTARGLCCIYKGHDKITELKFQSTEFTLSDEQMTNFGNYWNEYEAVDTSKSFEQVCDFLQATIPAEQCSG